MIHGAIDGRKITSDGGFSCMLLLLQVLEAPWQRLPYRWCSNVPLMADRAKTDFGRLFIWKYVFCLINWTWILKIFLLERVFFWIIGLNIYRYNSKVEIGFI